VHSQGPSQADVTEGSSGIWERLHYDWSDPNRVSSRQPTPTCGEATPVIRTPSRSSPRGRPTSTSSWSGEGKNFKGRALALVVAIIGKRLWKSSWARPSRRSRPGTTRRGGQGCRHRPGRSSRRTSATRNEDGLTASSVAGELVGAGVVTGPAWHRDSKPFVVCRSRLRGSDGTAVTRCGTLRRTRRAPASQCPGFPACAALRQRRRPLRQGSRDRGAHVRASRALSCSREGAV
jgi:hypothetical protein